ncbi:hypothetical protein LOTGIDRAFT_173519 [Lottia gigantea]|uniref:C2H2-type domain-containing protein n=1 Tax=Lottia gigantea TaxID=225164 RepID=V4ARB9_LOTGI|nr:hypothetical protein LOTGIDRAFT_173519 [Lottia gigantea]ESO99802.1 hypothetical protein LOTGIDRAFT_173519 [Lottia gigantea]
MADDSRRNLLDDFISSPNPQAEISSLTADNEQAPITHDQGIICPDKDLNQAISNCLPHTIAQNVTILEDSKDGEAVIGKEKQATDLNIPSYSDESLRDEDGPVFAQSNTDCVNFSLESNVSSEEQSSLHIEGEGLEEWNESKETVPNNGEEESTKVCLPENVVLVGISSPILDGSSEFLFKIEDIRSVVSEVFQDAQAYTNEFVGGDVPKESKQLSSEYISKNTRKPEAEGVVCNLVSSSKTKLEMGSFPESCPSSNTDHSVFTEADLSETLVSVDSGDFSESLSVSDDPPSQNKASLLPSSTNKPETKETFELATKNDSQPQEDFVSGGQQELNKKVMDPATSIILETQEVRNTFASDNPQSQSKDSLNPVSIDEPESPVDRYGPQKLLLPTLSKDLEFQDPVDKYGLQSNRINYPTANDGLQKSLDKKTRKDPETKKTQNPAIDSPKTMELWDPEKKINKSGIDTPEYRTDMSDSSDILVIVPSNKEYLQPNDNADSSFSTISQMEKMEISTPESSNNSSFEQSTEPDFAKDLQCSTITDTDFTSSLYESVDKPTDEVPITVLGLSDEFQTDRQVPLTIPTNTMRSESELPVTSEVDFKNELLKDACKSSSNVDQLDEINAATSSTSVIFGQKETHTFRPVDMSTDLQNSSIEESSSFEDNRLYIDEDKMSPEEYSEKLKEKTEKSQEKKSTQNETKMIERGHNEQLLVMNPEDFTTSNSTTSKDKSDRLAHQNEEASYISDHVDEKNCLGGFKVACDKTEAFTNQEDAESLIAVSQGFSLDDMTATPDEADNPHVPKQFGPFDSDSIIVINAAIIQRKAEDSQLPYKNIHPNNCSDTVFKSNDTEENSGKTLHVKETESGGNEDLLEKTPNEDSTATTDDPKKTPKESKGSKVKERRSSGNRRRSSNALNDEDESSSEDEDDDQNTVLGKDFEILHKKGTNRFACSCGFAEEEQYFATHLVRSHLIYKPFRCAYCKRCLLNKNYMKIHIREKHREEGQRPMLKEWSLVGLKKAEMLCQRARKSGKFVHNAKKNMAEAEAAKYSSMVNDVVRHKHLSEPTLIQPKPVTERSHPTELPVLKFVSRSARQASLDVDKSKPLQDTVVPRPQSSFGDANRTNSKTRHNSDGKGYGETQIKNQDSPTGKIKKNSHTSGIDKSNESSPKSSSSLPSRFVLIAPKEQDYPVQTFDVSAFNLIQSPQIRTSASNVYPPSYRNHHLPVLTSQEFQSNSAVQEKSFPCTWSQTNQILPSEEQIVPVMQNQNKSRSPVATTSTSTQHHYSPYEQTSVSNQNFSTVPSGMFSPENLPGVKSYHSSSVQQQQQRVLDRSDHNPQIFSASSNIGSSKHSVTKSANQASTVVHLLTKVQQSRNKTESVEHQHVRHLNIDHQSRMVNQLSGSPRNTQEAFITTATDLEVMVQSNRNQLLTHDLLSNCDSKLQNVQHVTATSASSQNLSTSLTPMTSSQDLNNPPTAICTPITLIPHMPKGITVSANPAKMQYPVTSSQTSWNSKSDLPTQTALQQPENIPEEASLIRADSEPRIRALLKLTDTKFRFTDGVYQCLEHKKNWKSRENFWWHVWGHLHMFQSEKRFCTYCYDVLSVFPKCRSVDKLLLKIEQNLGENPPEINPQYNQEATNANVKDSGSNNQMSTLIKVETSVENRFDSNNVSTAILIDSDGEPSHPSTDSENGADSVDVAIEKLKAFIAQNKTLEATHVICPPDIIEQRRVLALKIKSMFVQFEKREEELENRPPKTEEEKNCDRLKILRSIQGRLLQKNNPCISQNEENARNIAKLHILKEVTKVFGNDLNSTTSATSDAGEMIHIVSKIASAPSSVIDPAASVDSDVGQVSDRTTPIEPYTISHSSVAVSGRTTHESGTVSVSSANGGTTLNETDTGSGSSVVTRKRITPNRTHAVHASSFETSGRSPPTEPSTSSVVVSGRNTPYESGTVTASSIVSKSFQSVGPSQFFSCSLCRFSTLFALKFKKHLEEHEGQDILCIHCGYSSFDLKEFFKHFRGHCKTNPGLATFVCVWKSCKKYQRNKLAEFMHHLKMYHSKDDLTCCCCKSVFPSLDLFQAHLRSSLLTIVKCPHCQAKATDKKSMLQHIANYHPKKGRMISITKHLICNDRKLHGFDPLKMLAFQTEWLNQDEGDDDDVEFIEYIEAPPGHATNRPEPLEVKKEMGSRESSSSTTRNLSESQNLDPAKNTTEMLTSTTSSTTRNQLESRNQDSATEAPNANKAGIVHDSSLGETHFQLPSSSLSSLKEPVSESPQDHLKYRCHQCSFVAERSSILDDHLYKHRNLHQIDDEKDFSCMFCPTTFNDLTEMENHLQHHDEKISFTMYECTLDGFKTNQLHCLKTHIKDDLHQNHSNLNDMIRTSTVMLETKVSRCSKCDYKGIGKSSVMKHEMIHQAPKTAPREIAVSQQIVKASEMKHEIVNQAPKTEEENPYSDEFGRAFQKQSIHEAAKRPQVNIAVSQQHRNVSVHEAGKTAPEEIRQCGKAPVTKQEIINDASKTTQENIAPQPVKSKIDKFEPLKFEFKNSESVCSKKCIPKSGKDDSHQPTVESNIVSESYDDIHCVYKVTMGTSADRGTYFDQFDEKISKLYSSKDHLYHCRVCEKRCKMKRAIHDHLGKHLNIPYLCEICDYEDKLFSLLSSHMKDVHHIDNVRVIFPKNWQNKIDKLLKPTCDDGQAVGKVVREEKEQSMLMKRRFFVQGSKGIQTWTVDAKASKDLAVPVISLEKNDVESSDVDFYSDNCGTVENCDDAMDLSEIYPSTRGKLKRKISYESPTSQSKDEASDASSTSKVKKRKKSAVIGNHMPEIDKKKQLSSKDSSASKKRDKFPDTKKSKEGQNSKHSCSTRAQSSKFLLNAHFVLSSIPNRPRKKTLVSKEKDNFHLIQELCAESEVVESSKISEKTNLSVKPISNTEAKSNIKSFENTGVEQDPEIEKETTLNIKEEPGISEECAEEPKSPKPLKDDATAMVRSSLKSSSASHISKTKSVPKQKSPSKSKSRSPKKSNPMTIKFNFKKSNSSTKVTDSSKITKPSTVNDSAKVTKSTKFIDSLNSNDSDSIDSVYSVDSLNSIDSSTVNDSAKVTKSTKSNSLNSIDSCNSVNSSQSFDSSAVNNFGKETKLTKVTDTSKENVSATKSVKVIDSAIMTDSLDSIDSSKVTDESKTTVPESEFFDDDILLKDEPEQKMFECNQCSAKFYSLFQMQNHQRFLHRSEMKSSPFIKGKIFGQSLKKSPEKNSTIGEAKTFMGIVSSKSTTDACTSKSSTEVKSTLSETSLARSKLHPKSSGLKDSPSKSLKCNPNKPKVTLARGKSGDGSDKSSSTTLQTGTKLDASCSTYGTSSKADTRASPIKKSGILKRKTSSPNSSEPSAKKALTHKHKCSYCEKSFNSLMTLGKHFSLQHTDKGEILWTDVESGCTFNRTGSHFTTSTTCSHPQKFLCYCCDFRAKRRDLVKEHQKERHGQNKQIIKLSEAGQDMDNINTNVKAEKEVLLETIALNETRGVELCQEPGSQGELNCNNNTTTEDSGDKLSSPKTLKVTGCVTPSDTILKLTVPTSSSLSPSDSKFTRSSSDGGSLNVSMESSTSCNKTVSKGDPSFEVSWKMRFLISKAIDNASMKTSSKITSSGSKAASGVQPLIKSSSKCSQSSGSNLFKGSNPCTSPEDSQVQADKPTSDTPKISNIRLSGSDDVHLCPSVERNSAILSKKIPTDNHSRSRFLQKNRIIYNCPFCSYKIHKLYVYSRHLAKHKRFMKVAKKCGACMKNLNEEKTFSRHVCPGTKSAKYIKTSRSDVAVRFVDLIPLLILKDIYSEVQT